MKIIIAPDSFKGALTAQEAADAIETGIHKALPEAECIKVPMADGGEGTVRSLVDATGGRMVTVPVTGPLGQEVEAGYGILGDGKTAVIEMAAASGIQFVDENTKNPLVTTTYGTGQLLEHALDHGAHEVIIGLGGSATNDGGAGMARALGVRFLDADGKELPYGGGALGRLATIDATGLDPRLESARIRLASDVTNPLTGPQGASAVFGPQKGADEAMVRTLDSCLAHYAAVIREQLGRDVEDTAGAGAAGGLGAGFLAFTHAEMKSGVQIVVETTGLTSKSMGADYCFTGEGGIDFQTKFGKTPMGTAQAVKAASPSCKVVALAGSVGDGIDQLREVGIDAVFGISPGAVSLQEAIDHTAPNLTRVAENIARLIS
ncbi:glycerate kinase [Bifidobacterium xylocopae]|uniref:Glycerate 2-kinase n=1 Tax=Bifidobacterium xylocopae TaxID=2493119 RepID=A0A366KBG1_9BIFI|nr:glycerate kinase [Bifidobacterium xylocopae]RBP99066.1 glycerate 2-kinase [Bifidobacterium xylocopae]